MLRNLPWETIIRAVLKIGGGWFGYKAFHDESWIEGITAVGASVIGIIWGVIEKRRLKRRLAAFEAGESEPII
jgi:hypothetical protein